MFFGAPHSGLNVDSLVEMVGSITSENQQSTRHKLLEQLREDSEFLEDQRERLVQVWSNPRLRLFSFYELQTTPTVIKVRIPLNILSEKVLNPVLNAHLASSRILGEKGGSSTASKKYF